MTQVSVIHINAIWGTELLHLYLMRNRIHFLKMTCDRSFLKMISEPGRLWEIETVPYGTILSEFSGAGERGDLEAVFSHRNHSWMVERLPCLFLLLLHLSTSRWQGEINLCILCLFHINLRNSQDGEWIMKDIDRWRSNFIFIDWGVIHA